MDDGGGFGTATGKRVYMCHYIVSSLLLLLCCQIKVYILNIGLYFFDLLVSNRKTQLLDVHNYKGTKINYYMHSPSVPVRGRAIAFSMW